MSRSIHQQRLIWVRRLEYVRERQAHHWERFRHFRDAAENAELHVKDYDKRILALDERTPS